MVEERGASLTSSMTRIQNVAVVMARIEIWPVALLVAASVVSARALPLTLVIAGSFWLIRWLAYGRPSVHSPVDSAAALLVLMLLVTLWVTAWPETTRPQVYRLLSGIGLFYAIINWATSPTRLWMLVGGTLFAGVLLALSSPVSVLWESADGRLPFVPGTLYVRFDALAGDRINPNVMSGALVLLLPLALALPLFCWRQLSGGHRILVALTLLILTGALMLTRSRGALSALAAVLMVLPGLRWRFGWLLPLIVILFSVLVLASGVGVDVGTLMTSSRSGGWEERLQIWSAARYMIQGFAFTGIGMGSFQVVAERMYPLYMTAPGIPHAHNLFLQIAVDLGIPGLIAWLAIFTLVTATLWHVFRDGRTTGNMWAAGLSSGLLCSQLALALHGMTDAVTWGMVRPAILPWALWGLAIAAKNIYKPATASSNEHAIT